MADQKKRIIDLSELSQEVQEGQYILVDSAGGTGKMNLKKIVDDSTTSLTERVTDLETDLTEEENARSAADTELSGVVSDLQTALAAEKQAREEADEDIETALDNKAEKDGYYPSLYAGNLSSTRKQTDTVPYLMRKTGGDLPRVGEREDDTLVGATVNVNQLVNIPDGTRTISGITTVRSDGVKISYSGTSTATGTYIDAYAYIDTESFLTQFIAGHRYLIRAISSDNKLYIVVNKPYTDLCGINRRELIYTPSEAPTYFYVRVLVSNGEAVNGNGYLQIIDLTAMFGSSIADYLYSLETATAGAGIAKLRSWGFLRGYQAYNAGSIESVEVTGKKVTGFNQWDEVWEVHGSGSSARIGSKNYIPIIPNATYYLYCASGYTFSNGVRLYDANKTLIETRWNGGLQTMPSNCYYLMFDMTSAYGVTYNHGICINLSSSRNGEYEPYSAHTYDLGTDTLRGLFKLDSDNELYADGDTKTSDGTVTRKYGVVDLGTLTWAYFNIEGHKRFGASLSSKPSSRNLICTKYQDIGYSAVFNNTAQGLAIHTDGTQLVIYDPAYTDAATFKTAMSGVYLVYELATPTTEQSTPFTSPQVCYPGGTEEYVTSNGVPVGHETEYDYDIKGLAEGLIDVPDVPSTNGTYILKATRTADGLSYNWVTG